MMRRRILLIFLLACLAFPVPAEPISGDAAVAAEGAYIAFASSLVSFFSDVKLQGVFIDAENGIPEMISFVRSDISSYMDSFNFFSDAARTGLVPAIVGRLIGHEMTKFSAGDLVIDGVIRIADARNLELCISSDDWTGAEVDISTSLLLDGASVDGASVLEASFHLSGGAGRSISIEDESIFIDGMEYILDMNVYSF